MDIHIAQPNTRKSKPSYSKEFYDIFENLDEYSEKIFSATRIRPKKITLLEGETSVILKVFDGSNNIIVKIDPFPGNLFISNYFYQRLEETDVPVPKVFHFDDSCKIIPYDFQVLEFLDGTDLRKIPTKFYKQAGVLVGKALKKVHNIKTNGFGYPLTSDRWSAKSWLESLRTNYFDSSLEKNYEIFSKDEIENIEKVTFYNERLNISLPSLIHSDVGHGNGLYLVKGNDLSLVGFIDPGGIIGGDPMFDLAVGSNINDDFGNGIWEGYIKQPSLAREELYRFNHLKLLSLYWSTCWHYATKREFKSLRIRTLSILSELR